MNHTRQQRLAATRVYATWDWNRSDYDVTWSETHNCAVLIQRREHRDAAMRSRSAKRAAKRKAGT